MAIYAQRRKVKINSTIMGTKTTYPVVGWMKERFQVFHLDNDICEFEWTIQPGGGVPEHYHKESDEHFTILEGDATIKINGKKTITRKGDQLIVPKMTPHSIRNNSAIPVTCRVSFHPVADQGKFFQILFFLANKNPLDKNALFKALYISKCLNYWEFSTAHGGMKIMMDLMMGCLTLLSPLLGWNKLVKQFVLNYVKKD